MAILIGYWSARKRVLWTRVDSPHPNGAGHARMDYWRELFVDEEE